MNHMIIISLLIFPIINLLFPYPRENQKLIFLENKKIKRKNKNLQKGFWSPSPIYFYLFRLFCLLFVFFCLLSLCFSSALLPRYLQIFLSFIVFCSFFCVHLHTYTHTHIHTYILKSLFSLLQFCF